MTSSVLGPQPDASALDELRQEHNLILDVIERMEAAVSSQSARPVFVRASLVFVRTFLDENHHGKEERVLFPLMRRDGFLSELARSLKEDHDESRSLVAAIERTLDSGADPDRLSRLVSSFASLIRDHIRREDSMVFDAAEAVMSREDHASLADGFRQVEALALDGARADALLETLRRVEAAASQ